MSAPEPVTAVLPDWLRPEPSPGPMTRAGRDGDGGYVLPAAEMRDCDALLSLGVNDDWSFEQAFHAVRPRPVDAYDPTVSRVGFLLRALTTLLVAPIALLRRPRPLVRRIAREWGVFFSHVRFFRGAVRHRRLWVSAQPGPGQVTLAEGLRAGDLAACSRILVKMDIEGAEYAALAALPPAEWSRVGALLVEFHDVHLRLPGIRALARLLAPDFAVRHVHPNNCSPVRDGVPAVIEVTWSRRTPSDPRTPPPELPLAGLDQPNTAHAPDIRIRFQPEA